MAGQIVKRNENTWTVRIFLGREADGKRKYFNKTIRGSKKDAQKWLTAKLREKDLGQFVEPASMPVSEYLDRWLQDVAKNKIRLRTFNSYEALLKNHIKSKIGSKRLCDLQAYDIQKVYNGLIDNGYTGKTVKHIHNVLSPALKQAVKWKLITQNPCDLCELPKLVKKEMQYFTPEETAIFLEHAKADRYYAAFILAIETGMRPEEYLGLQWKDIDFEHSRLSVRRALVGLKGGGFYFDEPKTAKSRRSIPLSQTAIAALKSHRRAQLEARMKINDAYQDYDVIFASVIGTPIEHHNFDKRHFRTIIKNANQAITKGNEKDGEPRSEIRQIRLYDLRHTCATLLLAKGINPKIVSERLGHASIVLTLDTYSHVLPTMQKEATDQIEKLMFG
jgi:integrase